jgi:MFS family permease
MTREEVRAVALLASILSLRMLGIFMVLPIFSVYALRYPGASHGLVGLAFGIYALVQSIFQIPFGWASDRWGRKPLLLLGLSLFIAGSMVAGFARTITGLILGRALQGGGAISSVSMATLGDLTRDHVRARAFMVAGIAIGSSFVLGAILGPLLAGWLHLSGLFFVLAALGAVAFLLVWRVLPEPSTSSQHKPTQKVNWSMRPILPILWAAFVLAVLLNMFFYLYPLLWEHLGWERGGLWKIYLAAFLPSLLAFPMVRKAEQTRRVRIPMEIGWLGMLAAFLLLWQRSSIFGLLLASGMLFLFGYTLFQPFLPAFLTQHAPPEVRGRATGFYNLSGFLGSSLGGILAGVLSGLNLHTPLWISLGLLLIWRLAGFPHPPSHAFLEEPPHAP